MLITWCLEIALNSLETTPHICPLITSNLTHETPVLDSYSTSGFQTSVTDAETIPTRLVAPLTQSREGAPLTPVSEEMELLGEQKSAPEPLHTPVRAVESHDTSSSLMSATNSVKLFSHVNPLVGLCSMCGMATNEFTEEVIAQCVVAVGTCSHRMPHIVSSYLVSRIIPALAK